MDKSIAGLIGAVGALVAVAPARAASAIPLTMETALRAGSYADLLKPIPNAAALLATARPGPVPEARNPVRQVQYHHHHHHHHHHHDNYYGGGYYR